MLRRKEFGEMIPDFDKRGNLPPGIYEVTFSEVIQHFGGSISLKRSSLTKNLKEFVNFAKLYALKIYIDGSYVTNRLSPSDVDLLVIFPHKFLHEPSHERTRLSKFQKDREHNKLHIFPHAEGRDDQKTLEMLEWFMTDRQGNPKGIISLKLKG